VGKYGGIFGDAPKGKGEVLVSNTKTPKTRKDSSPKGSDKSKRGRPAGLVGGKRSDPAFTQKLVYLKVKSIEAADTKLRAHNKGVKKAKDRTDFSDIVQSLLDKWIAE
jgi:hypothetical protein